MKHTKKNRAISKVSAVLVIIAVAIAGALVYVWIAGEIGPSVNVDEKITILSIANDATDTDLLVYVQNIGTNAVTLDENGCLYVNGVPVNCTISGVDVLDDMALLMEGETATLRYAGGAVLPGVEVTVKVTTLLGTIAEKADYPAETTQ